MMSISRIFKQLFWPVFFLIVIRMSWGIGKYVTTDLEDLPFPQVLNYIPILPIILTHGFFGVLALLTGPFSFLLSKYPRAKKYHRVLGKLYLIAVLIGGLTGIIMSARAYGGIIPKAGFLILSLLWLYTAFQAFTTARAKNISMHKIWMIRNYALTFSAVMLRQYIGLMLMAGLDYDLVYPVAAWLSWVPQLLIIEFWFLPKINIHRIHIFKNMQRSPEHVEQF